MKIPPILAPLAVLAVLAALAALAVGLLAPAAADAKLVIKQGGGIDTNGRFSVIPDKYETDVSPGQDTRIPITLVNKTDAPVTVDLEIVNIGPAVKEESVVQMMDQYKYGAKEWVRPEITTLTLNTLEVADFDLIANPPSDAPVGTNFAGLAVNVSSNTGGEKSIAFKVTALAQLYLTVPGDIQRDISIASATVADSFIFNGSGFATYEIRVTNNGNVNDTVHGEIIVSSMFGNTITTLDIKPTIVFRGASRTMRVIWPKPPRFGRFGAVARIETAAQKKSKAFPTLIVLPPWWLLLLLLLCIVLPILYTVRQRRNSWKQYMDEDWDEELDEDEEWAEPTV